MTATSYVRGHVVYWDSNAWRYADTDELVEAGPARPCPRCGRMPTAEGHDACLGILPNVIGACCGHGVKDCYFIMGKADGDD